MKKHSSISQHQTSVVDTMRYGQVRDVVKQRRNLLQNPRNAEIEASHVRPRPAPKHLAPRDFQLELFKRAREQNTIAVLDTGSGKTFIAAMLLKEHILSEVAAREVHIQAQEKQRADGITVLPDRPRKLAFFLVDKVALAMQQSEFLQSACPGEIGFLYGALGVDNYSKAQWIDIYDKHHALVMTAAILVNCLSRGFISVGDISLLVFDECHHATSNHPYAHILRFYHDAKHEIRPRIFGMTASPVSSRKTPLTVIEKLEVMMDARVCTPSLDSSLSSFVVRPGEIVLRYDPIMAIDAPEERHVFDVHGVLASNKGFKKLMASAEYVTTELGPWARNRCWKMLVRDALAKVEAKSIYKEREGENLGDSKATLEMAHKLIVEQDALGKCSEASPIMSPKVQLLLDLLNEIYGEAEKRRESTPVVLLFCERRVTAYLLLSLITEMVKNQMHANIKPSIFIGQGGSEDAGVSMLIQRQVLVVDKFRRGDLNLLIATSVAEEGIDIPACNYVIRFDNFANVAQYIQSRGRARHPGSKFILCLENGAAKAEQALLDIKAAEARIREVCSQLPEDRVVCGIDVDMEDEHGDNDGLPLSAEHFAGQMTVLPEHAALNVIMAFCNSLGSGEYVINAPNYTTTGQGRSWQTVCMLPSICGIPPITGRVRTNRRNAKCSAAHAAVAALVARKLIDEYYIPLKPNKPEDLFLADDETLLFQSRDIWPIRKPALWGPSTPEQLFVARVTTDRSDGNYAPLLFITKNAPMPHMPLLEMSHEGHPFRMQVINLHGSIACTPKRLSLLQRFTCRLIKFAMYQNFTADDPAKFPYFVAIDAGRSLVAEEAIDWAEMQATADEDLKPFDISLSRYDLHDTVVRESTHHADYIFCGFEHNMTADSTYPTGDTRYDASHPEKTIRNWYATMKPDIQLVEGQTVLHARRFYKNFNTLAAPATRKRTATNIDNAPKIRKRNTHFLPQFCQLVNMRASLVTMGRLLPSLTTRLETLLLADEINKQLGTSIRLDLLAEAITARQANHGFDYERLEFLGDAFLKHIATTAVYLKFPHHPEGLLTAARTAIISNVNLRKLSIALGFPAYMRTIPLSKPKWRYTDQVVGPQVLARVDTTQRLGFKQVADVVESIMGAAFKSGGFDLGLQAATAMGVEMYGLNTWDAVRNCHGAAPPAFLAKQRYVHGETEVSNMFGYRFANNGLLEQALRHESCHVEPEDPVPSYERLELLGDAVLDIEAANYVYDSYPGAGPDGLSDLKSYIVCNRSLGEICEQIGLQKYLRQFHGGVLVALAEYATQAKFQRMRKQMKHGYANGQAQDEIASVVAPKFMSDMVESVVGAIFIDCGFRNGPANKVLHTVLLPYLDLPAALALKPPRPAMTLLSEFFQQYPCDEAELYRDLITDTSELRASNVLRSDQPNQQSELVLRVHGHAVVQTLAPSLAMAKLTLANEALTKLKDGKWMKERCDCAHQRLAKKLAEADPMEVEQDAEGSSGEE